MAFQLPVEELIDLALEAISDRAPERLRELLGEGVTIETGRSTHAGIDAALAWSQKGYEHLDRRYRRQAVERIERGYLVIARVEYVWRESGEVGDSAPIYLVFRIDQGLITGLALYDDEESARQRLMGHG